ncbi:MAG: N-acetyltransferase [Candidatus Bathyarchaeum tardum]|nr:MAG: N-acetyltransferase [Candidatus Bathyarchaeum tardum]
MNIRTATKDDLPGIMEIEQASFDMSEVFPETQFLHYLHRFADSFFVAEDSFDSIVGYAILTCAPSFGYILSIAVHPKNRNQGVAKELLEILESKCREKGIAKLRLDVRINNDTAIGLYKNLGLVEQKVKKNFYGKGLDGLLMEKKVKPLI